MVREQDATVRMGHHQAFRGGLQEGTGLDQGGEPGRDGVSPLSFLAFHHHLRPPAFGLGDASDENPGNLSVPALDAAVPGIAPRLGDR